MEKVPFKDRWHALSRWKKIAIVVVPILIVVIVAITLVACLLLIEPRYDVDLAKIVRADNLAWSDEFNGTALDETVWYAEDNYDCGGAMHRKKSINVANGELAIDIKYDDEAQEWRCGGIDTMPKYDQNGVQTHGKAIKYGYFEIRAKLADLGGCWSTFWLLSTNFTKATNQDAKLWGAEIDIVESPLHPKSIIQQAVHVGGWGNHHASLPNPKYMTQKSSKNLYQEYATYGLYWNAEIYKFYVDGKCVWTTNFNNNVSQQAEGIYLTIGTIAGGNDKLQAWAGGNHLYNNPKTASSSYNIDYVRVYKVYDDAGNILK